VTDAELREVIGFWADWPDPPPRVRVKANDYSYDGWLVGGAIKRSHALRALVEDEHGRLFVHNAGQLTVLP
jgi:hypothetical protein